MPSGFVWRHIRRCCSPDSGRHCVIFIILLFTWTELKRFVFQFRVQTPTYLLTTPLGSLFWLFQPFWTPLPSASLFLLKKMKTHRSPNHIGQSLAYLSFIARSSSRVFFFLSKATSSLQQPLCFPWETNTPYPRNSHQESTFWLPSFCLKKSFKRTLSYHSSTTTLEVLFV